MQVKEKTKDEIKTRAAGMSDYLKLEYYEECLRQPVSLDAKKFCHAELAVIYENKGMLGIAAKHAGILGEISLTYNEKIQWCLKSAELWLKEGHYDFVDKAVLNATRNANSSERREILVGVNQLYERQGEVFELSGRLNNALKIYEKLYKQSDEIDKKKLKQKLIFLCGKLGKLSELKLLQGN